MATMRLPTAEPFSDPLPDLVAQLSLLAEQAALLPEAAHELLGPAELEPVMLEAELLLRSSVHAFAALAQWLEREARGPCDDSGVRAVLDPGQLASLAHLARYSLASRRSELERILVRLRQSGDEALRWEAIQAAHGGAGEVIKAVTGVDLGLGALTPGHRGPVHFERAALVAIETRRALLGFRRSVDAGRAPTDDELDARLGQVASGLAQLSRLPIYPWLRVADRRALRELQRRIATLSASPDRVEARRLFQEAVNLSEIALSVNQRQELRALDRHLVDHAAVALARRGPVSAYLSLLEGRDEGLDGAARTGDLAGVHHSLERVRRTLEVDAALLFRCHVSLERVTRTLVGAH